MHWMHGIALDSEACMDMGNMRFNHQPMHLLAWLTATSWGEILLDIHLPTVKSCYLHDTIHQFAW